MGWKRARILAFLFAQLARTIGPLIIRRLHVGEIAQKTLFAKWSVA
jgi:hypothetical protein